MASCLRMLQSQLPNIPHPDQALPMENAVQASVKDQHVFLAM
jgi:hypothetical protein